MNLWPRWPDAPSLDVLLEGFKHNQNALEIVSVRSEEHCWARRKSHQEPKLITKQTHSFCYFGLSSPSVPWKSEYIVEPKALIFTSNFQVNYFPSELGKKILPGLLIKRKLCRVLWSSPVSPGWEGTQAGPCPFLQLQSAELPSSHRHWSLGPCPTEISERWVSVPQVVAILPLLGAGERGVFKNKTDIWKNLWFQL